MGTYNTYYQQTGSFLSGSFPVMTLDPGATQLFKGSFLGLFLQ